MSQWKRLLFYLSLNILVSACITLTVLWLWDANRLTYVLREFFAQNPLQGQPAPEQIGADPGLGNSPEIPVKVSTPVPPEELAEVIVIDNVFGAGNLDVELVLLKRIGKGELDLSGWKLKDMDGSTYTFPALTLFENGAVQVHSSAGIDSVVDLYWGKDQEIWKSGEMVTLLDDQGNIRASYKIP